MRVLSVFSSILVFSLIGAGISAAERLESDGGQSEFVPLGVTLESCNDLNADELQRALELEYRGELSGTMVTVVCSEESARVSVVGPDYPRGRIASIDLIGVSDIAIPRTIAIFASELWTAPEADPSVQVAASGSLSKSSSKNSTGVEGRSVVRTMNRLPSLRDSYRKGVSFGFGLGIDDRQIRPVSRDMTNSDGFIGWSLSAEWAAHPRVGVFASFGHGNSSPNTSSRDGETRIGIYDKGEIGAYVPILSEKWRFDLRVAAGYDKQYQPRTVKLDYEYLELGVDVRYFMRDNLMLTGVWSLQSINQPTREIRSRVGAGIGMRINQFLLEGKFSYFDAEIEYRGEFYYRTSIQLGLELLYRY